MEVYQILDDKKQPMNVPAIRVVCALRAQIYNQFLKGFVEFLWKSEFNTNSKVSHALLNTGVLCEYAQVLDRYVVSAVMCDFNKCRSNLYKKDWNKFKAGNTQMISEAVFFSEKDKFSVDDADKEVSGNIGYIQYFAWCISRQIIGLNGKPIDGVQAFFERNPRTEHACLRSAKNFIIFCTSMTRRLIRDWDIVNTVYFGADPNLVLTDISIKGFYSYRKGQQVVKLSFKHSTGNGAIIYKPGNLEIDCNLVGSISEMCSNDSVMTLLNAWRASQVKLIYGDSPPDGISTSFFKNNQSIAEYYNTFAVKDKAARIGTYKILPMTPGSLFNSSDPVINLDSCYGYIDYLSHNDEDFITLSERKVSTFYQSMGAFQALSTIFSVSDLHQGNCIAHKYLPYFIDLEASFGYPFSSPANSHLLYSKDGAATGGALSTKESEHAGYMIINDKRASMRVSSSYLSNIQNSSNFLADHDNKPYSLLDDEYDKWFLDGFTYAIRKLIDNNVEVKAMVKAFGNTYNRDIIDTKSDKFLVGALYGYKYSDKEIKSDGNPDYVTLKNDIVTLLASIKRSIPSPTDPPYNWSNLDDAAVWSDANSFQDLYLCDIPIYSRNLNHKKLRNSRGQIVNPKQGTDFYADTSLTFIDEQIEAGDERRANDLAALQNLLTTSKATKLKTTDTENTGDQNNA